MRRAIPLALALLAAAASTAHASAKYSAYPIRVAGAERPPRIEFPGTLHTWLDGVTWRSWGSSTVEGSGSFVFERFDADPDDPGGDVQVLTRYPATVRLTSVRSCRGQRLYSRLLVRLPFDRPDGIDPSLAWSMSCPRALYWDPGLKPVIRPRTFYFGANGYIKNVRWRSWSSGWDSPTTAKGRGYFGLNDCKPNCAAGRVRFIPAAITLSHPGTCDAAGEDIYRRILLRYGGRATKLYITKQECRPAD